MNRVYLVATAASKMEAKVQEIVEALTKVGLIASVYKPFDVVSAADSVEEIKAGKSAVLMEKICADFLKQDFDAVDAVVVEGATGMNDVIAHKYNDDLASALDAKIFADGEDADLFCPKRLLRCEKCLAADLAEPAAERRVSQAMFRASLLSKASKSVKRIVLPEGSEPRTVQAACLAVERNIAVPVLIGKKEEIEATAKSVGVKLPANIEIIEPSAVIVINIFFLNCKINCEDCNTGKQFLLLG